MPTPNLLELPLNGGLAQHVDSRKLQGGLISGVNVRQEKIGRYGKRFGTVQRPLTTTAPTPIAAPFSFGTRGEEQLLLERGRLHSWSAPANRWAYTDKLPEYHCKESPVPRAVGNVGNASIARIGNLTCYAWNEDYYSSGGTADLASCKTRMVVVDDSGAVVSGPVTMGKLDANPRWGAWVVALNNAFVVVTTGAVPSPLSAFSDASVFSLSTMAWGPTTRILTSGFPLLGQRDVFANTDGGTFIVLTSNAANVDVDVFNFSLSLVQSAHGLPTGIAVPDVALLVSGAVTPGLNVLWLAFAETKNPAGSSAARVFYSVYNLSNLSAIAGPTLVSSGIDSHDPAIDDSYTLNGVSVSNLCWYRQGGSNSLTAVVSWTHSANKAGGGGGGVNIRRTSFQVVDTGALIGPKHVVFGAINMSKVVITPDAKAYMFFTTRHAVHAEREAQSPPSGTLPISTPLQGTTLLCELPFAYNPFSSAQIRPVCTWAPRISIGDEPGSGAGVVFAYPFTPIYDSSGAIIGIGTQTEQSFVHEEAALGLGGPRTSLFGLRMLPTYEHHTAELGGLTYITGGVPSWYDGRSVGEIGFLQYPTACLRYRGYSVPNPYVVTVYPYGYLAQDSVYQWAFIYAHLDGAGNLHRSSPFVVSATTGHDPDHGWVCELEAQHLQLTNRHGGDSVGAPLSFEVYRTIGNGSQFHRRTTSYAPPTNETSSSTGTLQNDPSADEIVFTDRLDDGSITSSQLLYTSGGILEGVCPPSASLICAHRGRIFLGGTPDGETIWASTQQIYGEAPLFNEALTFRVDGGGEVTALASLDDKLVIFKSDRVFIVTGAGPDDRGLNSDWSDPINIHSTVGAISPHVVLTPLGLIFRSAVGLSLLTRDLQVQPHWGQAVEDELASFPVFCGAALHPTLPEIRFVLTNAAGTVGRELRYDYRHEAWFQAWFQADGDIDFRAPLCCIAPMGGTMVYGSTGDSGPVAFAESQSTWTDMGSFVFSTLEFAPVAPGGTQGYITFRSAIFSGDKHTDHDLIVSFAYDDADYTDSKIVSNAVSSTWQSYQFEVSPPSANKCERLRVKVEDDQMGAIGNGRGWSISSIAFDVEPRSGPNRRLPAAQRL